MQKIKLGDVSRPLSFLKKSPLFKGMFQRNARMFWETVNPVKEILKIRCDIYVLMKKPMDTSSSIRHRFDAEIPRGKFVEISSIFKGESTWKLCHWFDVEILTWIRLLKSTKYRRVFHVDFSMSFRRRIGVTSVPAVSVLSFPNIFCPGNLF